MARCRVCGGEAGGTHAVCEKCALNGVYASGVRRLLDGIVVVAETDIRIAACGDVCRVCAHRREDCERYDRRCERCRESGKCLCEVCDTSYSKFEWRGLA